MLEKPQACFWLVGFFLNKANITEDETALNSFLHLNGDLNCISYSVRKNSE